MSGATELKPGDQPQIFGRAPGTVRQTIGLDLPEPASVLARVVRITNGLRRAGLVAAAQYWNNEESATWTWNLAAKAALRAKIPGAFCVAPVVCASCL